MNLKERPKLVVGFAMGAVAGVIGVIFGQSMLGGREAGSRDGAELATQKRLVERLQEDLGAARQKSAELAKENSRISAELVSALDGRTVAPELAAGDPDPEAAAKPNETIFDVLMAMGADKGKREVDAKVAMLAKRLNLTPSQQDEVRAALLAKLERQQNAGKLLMQGKATLADLQASDEHNFSEVDAAMAGILSEAQLEEYALVQEEREFKRIEDKANEDLKGLQDVADLSEEQADQVWDVFVELIAAEKPGSLPEGATMDDFNTFVDQAIGNRIDRLQPILTAPQLDAYRAQTEAFRTMITALVGRGTGAE